MRRRYPGTMGERHTLVYTTRIPWREVYPVIYHPGYHGGRGTPCIYHPGTMVGEGYTLYILPGYHGGHTTTLYIPCYTTLGIPRMYTTLCPYWCPVRVCSAALR